jgi:hypothetical protein
LGVQEGGSFILYDLIELWVVFEVIFGGETIESVDVLGIFGGSLDGDVVVDIFNLD